MSTSVEESVDVIRRGYDVINREGPDGARASVALPHDTSST